MNLIYLIIAFVVEDLYVALYSAPNSIELLFLLKIARKDVAEDNMIDIYGHTIPKGSQYIVGHYLEKVREKRDKVFYRGIEKKRLYIQLRFSAQQFQSTRITCQ